MIEFTTAIEKKILFHKELSLLDIRIFSLVQSFIDSGKQCFASNNYFSEICAVHFRKIQNSLDKMEKLRVIGRVFDNGNRFIHLIEGKGFGYVSESDQIKIPSPEFIFKVPRLFLFREDLTLAALRIGSIIRAYERSEYAFEAGDKYLAEQCYLTKDHTNKIINWLIKNNIITCEKEKNKRILRFASGSVAITDSENRPPSSEDTKIYLSTSDREKRHPLKNDREKRHPSSIEGNNDLSTSDREKRHPSIEKNGTPQSRKTAPNILNSINKTICSVVVNDTSLDRSALIVDIENETPQQQKDFFCKDPNCTTQFNTRFKDRVVTIEEIYDDFYRYNSTPPRNLKNATIENFERWISLDKKPYKWKSQKYQQPTPKSHEPWDGERLMNRSQETTDKGMKKIQDLLNVLKASPVPSTKRGLRAH